MSSYRVEISDSSHVEYFLEYSDALIHAHSYGLTAENVYEITEGDNND